MESRRPGQGGRRKFIVHGPNGNFIIRSHAYPNGDNGDALLAVNPDAGHYNLEDADDCTVVDFDDDADPTAATFVTEHILELQTLPRFLELTMGVPADLRNGQTRTTTHVPIPQAALGDGSNFLAAYNNWDPG